MTVTESKPETVVPDPGITPAQPPLPPEPAKGFAGILGTADHKTVGRLYVGVSLLFLTAFLVTSMLVKAEGMQQDSLQFLNVATIFEVQTLSQIGVVFLGLMPAFLGLALFVVPLQVGSPTIAFPRAAAASFWGWLLGAGLLVASYLGNGGPVGANIEMVKLFFVAFAMVIVSLGLASVCVITTVATARAEGMNLLRVPLFSWSMLVAGSMWLLHSAALLANLLIVSIDTTHGQVLYGDPANRWIQLTWIFAQPAVLCLALPLLGVFGDAAIVATRIRPARYGVSLGAIGAVGALSFGAYAQTAFHPGLITEALFVLQSLAVVLPLLVLLGGIGDSVRRGRLRVTSAFLVSLAGMLLLLGAAVAGGLYAIEPLNLGFTVWGAGVANAATAAAIAGVAAGLFHWGSKIWGHRVAEPIGKLVFLVVLGGGVLYAAGELIAGANGQLPVLPDGSVENLAANAELGALLSTVGCGLLAAGTLLVILAVLPAALRRGPKADADPWGGQTLEWTTSSPPHPANFLDPVPEVRSPSPLLDLREGTSKEIV